jgi:hypothetical protein
MDRIWNRYNLKSTGRIYTFGILKCSEKFKVLDLPQYISIKIKLNLTAEALILDAGTAGGWPWDAGVMFTPVVSHVHVLERGWILCEWVC